MVSAMSKAGLIGAAEAAELIGVSQRQIARRVENGTLKAFAKMPGRTGSLIFDRAYIERLAAEERSRNELNRHQEGANA